MQLAVLLLKAGVLHLELGVGLQELGVGVEALLQASLNVCELLLHRVCCCFLLVPGGLGGDPVLQLPPHHPLLRAEVVQVGSLPGRGLVLGVFLLDVQQEFLWLRRHGWGWSLASNHRCHRPRVGREHWGDGGRGKERGGRAGRQECRGVPVHGGGSQAEQRLLSSQH